MGSSEALGSGGGMGRELLCEPMGAAKAVERGYYSACRSVGRHRNGRRGRSFHVSGQILDGPRSAAFLETGLKRKRRSSWRLTSVGDEAAIGFVQVTPTAVRAQGDIHAGSSQEARGERFPGGRRRGRNVEALADGGEDGFTLAGGHPAEVAEFVKAVGQHMGEESAGEELHGDGFGLLGVGVGPVAPGVGDAAGADGFDAVDPAPVRASHLNIPGRARKLRGR